MAQQAELAHKELPTPKHLFWSYGSFWNPIMMLLARLRFVFAPQGLAENEHRRAFRANTKNCICQNLIRSELHTQLTFTDQKKPLYGERKSYIMDISCWIQNRTKEICLLDIGRHWAVSITAPGRVVYAWRQHSSSSICIHSCKYSHPTWPRPDPRTHKHF